MYAYYKGMGEADAAGLARLGHEMIVAVDGYHHHIQDPFDTNRRVGQIDQEHTRAAQRRF